MTAPAGTEYFLVGLTSSGRNESAALCGRSWFHPYHQTRIRERGSGLGPTRIPAQEHADCAAKTLTLFSPVFRERPERLNGVSCTVNENPQPGCRRRDPASPVETCFYSD